VKHILAIFFGLISLIGIYFFIQYDSAPISFRVSRPSRPTPTQKIVPGSYQKFLFVPYWGMTTKQIPKEYDKLIYFGITPNNSGIDMQEIGYKNIPFFINHTDMQSSKLLTIRMLDTDIDAKVLQDKNFAQKIISDSCTVATKYGFTGVVLDFEYNALAFDSVVQSITNFSQTFANEAKQQGLTFYQIVYGDTFYRLRPFDLEKLATHADGIIVLAYDFHKANGDAGPNFPLSGHEVQGYDFKTMTTDFIRKVPATKLIVAFGLFGYDWLVDNQGHSSGLATPLSFIEAQQKFFTSCGYTQCVIKKDDVSSEVKITYKDISQNNHIVWIEDMESIAKKSAYLKTQGINATALWAWSYF